MPFTSSAESNILPTERRVLRVRMHWASTIKYVAIAVSIIVVVSLIQWLLTPLGATVWVLQTILFGVDVLTLLYLAYHLAWWWHEVIMVTDKRFVMVSGIFTEKIDMMPVSKVTDLTYFRSFMGIILNYGTLRIESAGQHQALEFFDFIPDPKSVYEALTKLLFGGSPDRQSNTLPPPADVRRQRRRRPIRAIDDTRQLPSTDDISNRWPVPPTEEDPGDDDGT